MSDATDSDYGDDLVTGEWPNDLGDGHVYQDREVDDYCDHCGWPWFRHEELPSRATRQEPEPASIYTCTCHNAGVHADWCSVNVRVPQERP